LPRLQERTGKGSVRAGNQRSKGQDLQGLQGRDQERKGRLTVFPFKNAETARFFGRGRFFYALKESHRMRLESAQCLYKFIFNIYHDIPLVCEMTIDGGMDNPYSIKYIEKGLSILKDQ
jgi:hypothetical protein